MDKIVTAVVMDSRGIYVSFGRGEVEKFTGPLPKSLEALQKTTKQWLSLALAEDCECFNAAAKKLAEFI